MLAKIESSIPSLSKSGKKIANYVLANPQRTVDSYVGGLAESVGVSEPTIIRFCRTLGFQGFQDFKLRLAQTLAGGQALHREISDDDSPLELAFKILDSASLSLQTVRNQLNNAELDSAFKLLRQASRIEFYGLGGSGIVAQDAQQKFFRLGIPAVAYSDPHIHCVAASLLDPTSVVVAISYSGRSIDLIHSVQNAKNVGAKVIALTATGSPLAADADVFLPLDIEEDSDHYAPIKSRLAQLVILDILAVGVAQDKGHSLSLKLAKASQALSSKYISDN